MTTYRVRGPDGQVHEFSGPANATPDQVLAAAQAQFGSQQPQGSPQDRARAAGQQEGSQHGGLVSGLYSAANSALFGGGDYVAAATRYLAQHAASPHPDDFNTDLAYSQGASQGSREQNPGSSIAGDIAGALVPGAGLAHAVESATGLGAKLALKEHQFLPNLLRLVGSGALAGGEYGAVRGGIEGGEQNGVSGVLPAAALGGATGVVTGAATAPIGAGIGYGVMKGVQAFAPQAQKAIALLADKLGVHEDTIATAMTDYKSSTGHAPTIADIADAVTKANVEPVVNARQSSAAKMQAAAQAKATALPQEMSQGIASGGATKTPFGSNTFTPNWNSLGSGNSDFSYVTRHVTAGNTYHPSSVGAFDTPLGTTTISGVPVNIVGSSASKSVRALMQPSDYAALTGRKDIGGDPLIVGTVKQGFGSDGQHVVVSPEFRRQGLATQLADLAKAHYGVDVTKASDRSADGAKFLNAYGGGGKLNTARVADLRNTQSGLMDTAMGPRGADGARHPAALGAQPVTTPDVAAQFLDDPQVVEARKAIPGLDSILKRGLLKKDATPLTVDDIDSVRQSLSRLQQTVGATNSHFADDIGQIRDTLVQGAQQAQPAYKQALDAYTRQEQFIQGFQHAAQGKSIHDVPDMGDIRTFDTHEGRAGLELGARSRLAQTAGETESGAVRTAQQLRQGAPSKTLESLPAAEQAALQARGAATAKSQQNYADLAGTLKSKDSETTNAAKVAGDAALSLAPGLHGSLWYKFHSVANLLTGKGVSEATANHLVDLLTRANTPQDIANLRNALNRSVSDARIRRLVLKQVGRNTAVGTTSALQGAVK